MQFHLKYMLFVFMFTSITISTGFGIKCWSCNSQNDPRCADPFDNTTIPISDCGNELGLSGTQRTMCQKIRQKVNGEWHVIRECAVLGEVGVRGDERICLKKTKPDNTTVEYCTCNSRDGCNSSFNFKPSSLLFVLMVFPALFVKILS